MRRCTVVLVLLLASFAVAQEWNGRQLVTTVINGKVPVTYAGGTLGFRLGTDYNLNIDADGVRLFMPPVLPCTLATTSSPACSKNYVPTGIKVVVNIPASSISEIAYGQEEHNRAGEGVALGVLVSPVAGALWGATHYSNHFIGIKWVADGQTQGVLLQCDPSKFQEVLSTLESVTGKRVVISAVAITGKPKSPEPPESQGIPVHLLGNGSKDYANYAARKQHKAFAVSLDGHYGSADGYKTEELATSNALAWCQRYTRECQLVMVDDKKVGDIDIR